MKKTRTHYDNLQVTENASPEVIKGAYKYLTQKWHPDKNPSDRAKAERVMKILTAAYEILSDPERRKNYDQKIARQRSKTSEGQPEQERGEAAARDQEQTRKEAEKRRQEQVRKENEERRQEQARKESEERRQEQARWKAEARRREQADREAEAGTRRPAGTPDPVSASGGNEYVSAMRKYAVFSGTATRKEYWMYVFYNLLFSFAIGFFESVAGLTDQLVLNIYTLAVFVPSISVGVRRMHDTDRSGWWFFLPIINLVFLCQKSVGPHTKEQVKTPAPVVVVLTVFGLIFFVGILAAIALPSYQDYIVRSKISEALVAMVEAKTSVSEYVSANGDFPIDSRSFGVNTANRTESDILASLSVDNYVWGDTIRIVANVRSCIWAGDPCNDTHLRSFHLAGSVNADGTMSWTCQPGDASRANAIEAKYLPAGCRESNVQSVDTHVVAQDSVQAVARNRKAAEQGNAYAQSNLGVMYENGQGAPQDYATYVTWYIKAVEQGDADAQYNLGFMYENGQGVPQDYATAVKWYTKAAEQGDAVAQFNLGFMYDNGQGVPQDYATAVKWYTKAAEQGDADAQVNLGVMYDYGKGVPQDYNQAFNWYRKAAEQGNAYSQFNLGFMYYDGQGVRQDYKQGLNWYRKAAEQGNANAQFNLGLIYHDGYGVPQDHVQAHMWLSLAAASGNETAAGNRDKVADKMTPAQIEQAQRLAREWTPIKSK